MDDVESPSPQGEVEGATAPLPITTEPSNDTTQQTYAKVVTYIAIPGSWEGRADPSRPSFTPPDLKPGQIAYITKGTRIAWSGTARLERLPSGDVVKTPHFDPDRRYYEAHCQDMRLEARIYDAVGAHPRYLENGSLKEYISANSGSLTPQLRRRWARQASEGLGALHAAGVIHCDISPRNFLRDGDLCLKIADFGGGSLNGSAPSAVAGTRFRYPVSDWDAPARFEEDVFGLGSLIYFIMSLAMRSRTFPDVTELACGDIITRCWGMQVSAAEVHAYFEALDG
ncbi:hypothetical protein VE03_05142 [Pseudogymnoascus sp. 23342-1-I1]|nr:hypothetical protein VE03_05142 [Pseudogymnoascus sp. 23342-1-I1]